MNIDAHQHFWRYDPRQYPWINEGKEILQRDYLPEDLVREMAKAHLNGSIAVQARQTPEETRWLLELATKNEHIKAVVGWVDLRSERVEEQLRQFASHAKFVGVRHVVQDEPDDRFVLRADFLCGIGKLEGFGLTYDILIYSRQLPAAIELVRQFPGQPFVLDHVAKPPIKDRILSPWKAQIEELARFPNVLCKVSGLVTEARWHGWKKEDFRPYLDVVFQAFGEDRLMIGSDWPVCLLSATYEQVLSIPRQYFSSLSETSRNKIFGGNALKFYGVSGGA